MSRNVDVFLMAQEVARRFSRASRQDLNNASFAGSRAIVPTPASTLVAYKTPV